MDDGPDEHEQADEEEQRGPLDLADSMLVGVEPEATASGRSHRSRAIGRRPRGRARSAAKAKPTTSAPSTTRSGPSRPRSRDDLACPRRPRRAASRTSGWTGGRPRNMTAMIARNTTKMSSTTGIQVDQEVHEVEARRRADQDVRRVADERRRAADVRAGRPPRSRPGRPQHDQARESGGEAISSQRRATAVRQGDRRVSRATAVAAAMKMTNQPTTEIVVSPASIAVDRRGRSASSTPRRAIDQTKINVATHPGVAARPRPDVTTPPSIGGC